MSLLFHNLRILFKAKIINLELVQLEVKLFFNNNNLLKIIILRLLNNKKFFKINKFNNKCITAAAQKRVKLLKMVLIKLLSLNLLLPNTEIIKFIQNKK
jgi:hypothetical protein